MARFVIVHNIPSPYRLHLFRVMNSSLDRRNHRLEVHFMAAGHSDRKHWNAGANLGFNSRYWWDLPIPAQARTLHLNPSLLLHLLANPPDILMVGGPWDSLTGVLSSFPGFARRSIAWFEGNTRTPGRVTGIARATKRALLGRYTSLAVPGAEGAALARMIIGNNGPPIDILPNIVDECFFRNVSPASGRLRRELNILPETRIAVWPARQIPAKGVHEFLSAIDSNVLKGWAIVIIGEGPLAANTDELIIRRGLAAHVRRIDSLPYDQMPDVYQSADLFLLPSMHDPNPLSVVEAMHSGLPILVSNRIGNLPEALCLNGWSLDPSNRLDVQTKVKEALSAPSEELRRLGDQSRTNAERHWASRPAVERFLDSVLQR